MLKPGDELDQRNAECGAPETQFDEVEAPFAALAFAHERLSFAQSGGKLDLRQFGNFSGRPQKGEQVRVLL